MRGGGCICIGRVMRGWGVGQAACQSRVPIQGRIGMQVNQPRCLRISTPPILETILLNYIHPSCRIQQSFIVHPPRLVIEAIQEKYGKTYQVRDQEPTGILGHDHESERYSRSFEASCFAPCRGRIAYSVNH
jgi:hypothetical protein